MLLHQAALEGSEELTQSWDLEIKPEIGNRTSWQAARAPTPHRGPLGRQGLGLLHLMCRRAERRPWGPVLSQAHLGGPHLQDSPSF